MKKPCECKKPLRTLKNKCCPKAVEIDYIEIPANMGTSEAGQPFAPENGTYHNAVVKYIADGTVWIYTTEGIPVRLGSGGGGGGDVISVNGKTGVVVLTTSDIYNDSGYQTGSDVAASILVETTARELADNGLQGQIDALAASSDVTDIVGTYADLQAYDTTRLKDNDIIKVLQDEEHDDETTYYRWSTSTEVFTLIGEEGPYYTKAAADSIFQDKLTAGANISINANNEISATDTTYTAGTNVSISSANQISANAKTIFYVNVLEAGTTRHIYKDDDFATAATAQEVITAIENTAVMISMFDANSPTEFNMLALENYWNYPGDIQFIFTDGNTLYDFGCSATTDTTFDYSSGVLQKKLTAGTNVSIVGTTISATDTTYTAGTGIDLTSGAFSINIGYLALNGAGAPTTATVAAYVGQLYYDTTNSEMYYCSAITPQGTDPETYTYTWTQLGGGGGGFDPYSEARSRSDVYIPDGSNYNATYSSVVISPQNLSSASNIQNRSVNILGKASNYAECVQIGYQSSIYGADAIAIGDADAAASSISIGRNAGTTGGNYSVSIGRNATNVGQYSTILGYYAAGTNAYAPTAVGAYASVGIYSYAVALGAYSKCARSSEVSIGDGANADYGTRYLANVRDPQLAHDGANKNYVDNRIIAGGTTAPTSATVGEVGTLYSYVSGTTGHLAICTEIDTTDPDNPVYTWSTLI